jgi:hypothetical protein
LNKNPEEQKKLYQQITTNRYIPGEQAIRIAREIKGHFTIQKLIISYTTKEELIKKLELILQELKWDTQLNH